jgi:hypothetical protein
MTRSPDLTAAELRVMKALWEVGRGTVAEVRAELARRADSHTTVILSAARCEGRSDCRQRREPFIYPARQRESVFRPAPDSCAGVRRRGGLARAESRRTGAFSRTGYAQIGLIA